MVFHNHKDFKCPHCGKDFSKERKLKQHLRDKHSEDLNTKKKGKNECYTAKM